MKRLALLLTILSLLVPTPSQALEFTVSASSQFMPLFGEFGPELLLDGDPETAWAEGVEGDGTGEWVLFEFGRELLVERIGLRAGWQSGEEFAVNNRPAEVLLVFSDGSRIAAPLEDAQGWQWVDVGRRTSEVRVVIARVTPGESMLTYNRTCISDVSFEVALPPGAVELIEPAGDQSADPESADPASPVEEAPGREPLDELPAVDMRAMGDGSAQQPAAPVSDASVSDTSESDTSESDAPGGTGADVAQRNPGEPTPRKTISLSELFSPREEVVLPPVDVERMSGSGESDSPEAGADSDEAGQTDADADSDAATQADADAPSDAEADRPERAALEELPEVDVPAMSGERKAKGGKVAGPRDQKAVRDAIRAYFTRLVTLDDSYLDLYADSVRDDEAFVFEYFKELQRQRRVFHLFRRALVDTEGLRFGPALVKNVDRIELEVTGGYTIYIADTYEDMPVHTLFEFVRESDGWKIHAAEDREEAAP